MWAWIRWLLGRDAPLPKGHPGATSIRISDGTIRFIPAEAGFTYLVLLDRKGSRGKGIVLTIEDLNMLVLAMRIRAHYAQDEEAKYLSKQLEESASG